MLDRIAIRKDFPILSRIVNSHQLVYLDNAATSQKPSQVVSAISEYYLNNNANVHRGVHTLSTEATEGYESAREVVKEFIHAPSSNCIIWTKNATESFNIVAYSWGNSNVKQRDNIVTTAMEHHSNLVPWQQLSKRTGAELRIIPILQDGTIDIQTAKQLIDSNTKLVAVTQMSNVLGSINPVKRLARIAHSNGAVIVVDGAQSVPHFPVDVQDIDCDFIAFSAHKMLGPTGIGVLYGKEDILDSMPPFMFGGEMISEVTYQDANWNKLPYKFEAGTPNIAGAIGTAAAVTYLNSIGMSNVWTHEQKLTEYAFAQFKQLDGITVLGPQNSRERGGLISFILSGIHSHDIGTVLNSMGIAIRTGHHCAMPLIKSYGQVASARASFYIYNTKDEIDILIDGIKKVQDYF